MSDWLIEELLGDDDYIPQPDEYDDDPEPKSLGGPGSGNFGHAGRPGEIGGSALAAEGNRIFKTRDDLKLNKGWYGEKDYYTWKDKPGMMVTGRVLDKAELPDTLYHVTTNATAVESSGYLRGQNADVGLGGGQEDGVSFTTDLTDAKVIQRELRRAVEIAQQKHTIESLDRFAREDEQEAGMAEGSLNDAVNYARRNWDVNITSPVYDSEQKKASLLEDVFKMYLQIRGNSKDPLLKNPMLFGRQEHLRNLDPNNIRTLHVPKSGIPDRALVTSGSDDFLHEVRVYSDVPVAGMRVAGGPGSGNFGHAGRPGSPDEYDDLEVLGGKGSGNFGHKGRPGQVGGSAGWQSGSYDAPRGQEENWLNDSVRNPLLPSDLKLEGSEQADNKLIKEYHSKTLPAKAIALWDKAVTTEIGRGNSPTKVVPVDKILTRQATLATRIVEGYKRDLESMGRFIIGGANDPVGSAIKYGDQYLLIDGNHRINALMRTGSKRVEIRIVAEIPKARDLGGPGSGNFGHAGRPGEIGGSAPAEMPAHAKETLDAWIADSDYAINAAARSKQDSALVKRMDEVIAASPVVDGTVYRGVSLDPEDPNQIYILDNLRKGYSFGEKGFSSVTSNEKIATDFATGGNTGNVEVVFEMKVSGRRGAVVPSGLDETVLERGVTYKIDKVVRNGSRVKVTGRIF